MGPTIVGPEINCQSRGSQIADFETGFAYTANASYNYTFFQLLYKHYVALNSSKVPDFDDAITYFYMNFFQASRFEGCYIPHTFLVATSLTACAKLRETMVHQCSYTFLLQKHVYKKHGS